MHQPTGIYEPAKAVTRCFAVIELARGERLLEGYGLHEFFGVKGLVPAIHVFDRGINVVLAINRILRSVTNVVVNAILEPVTYGAVTNRRVCLVIQDGSFHSERLENVLLEELGKPLSGELFHNLSEYDVA